MSEWEWRLVTHEPGRIVRCARSDDPAWVRVQVISGMTGDEVREARVRVIALRVDELERVLAEAKGGKR